MLQMERCENRKIKWKTLIIDMYRVRMNEKYGKQWQNLDRRSAVRKQTPTEVWPARVEEKEVHISLIVTRQESESVLKCTLVWFNHYFLPLQVSMCVCLEELCTVDIRTTVRQMYVSRTVLIGYADETLPNGSWTSHLMRTCQRRLESYWESANLRTESWTVEIHGE